MRRVGTALLAAALLLGSGCGGGGEATEDAERTVAATSSTAPDQTTSSPSVAPPSTTVEGGLDGDDAFVRSIVGSTYGAAVTSGTTAHQAAAFGKKGSWTLFTVEHEGHWYAFTTKNPPGDGGVGVLNRSSEVATGERLRDLPDGHWYGVEGIVRDGRAIGGVMLQGRGYDREPDGTFPAVAAWRVNLETLRLEPTSIAGLDVVESCG